MQNKLKLYRYSIPFQKPFRTAVSVFRRREGFILGDGDALWTEIAPLPGYSIETTDQVGSLLTQHHKEIEHHFNGQTLDEYLSSETCPELLSLFPSIKFGLSMLSEQQKALLEGVPLYKYWINFSHGPGQKSSAKTFTTKDSSLQQPSRDKTNTVVQCNAIAGRKKRTALLQEIRVFLDAGFSTIKIKLPPQPEEALSLIKSVCIRFPQLMFRFDANGTFSLEQAAWLLKQIRTYQHPPAHLHNIDYIEEPAGNISPEEFAALHRLSPVRLAADESARTPYQARTLLNHHAVDVIVLKPMLFGSFLEMANLRDAFGSTLTRDISDSDSPSSPQLIPAEITITVSSSIETGIGRALLAHLACFLDTSGMTHHGLATGKLLNGDIAPNNHSHRTSASDNHASPVYPLSSQAGIGIRPDIRQPSFIKPAFTGSDT
ncbi:MAG: enolase C-terminal domain-like protein [Balneolales bacterium]